MASLQDRTLRTRQDYFDLAKEADVKLILDETPGKLRLTVSGREDNRRYFKDLVDAFRPAWVYIEFDEFNIPWKWLNKFIGRYDQHMLQIGSWSSRVSITVYSYRLLKVPFFRPYCKYWEFNVKRVKVRIWKPVFLRCH